MTDELWRPYDRMADEFLAHADDGAQNSHYGRPAVLDLLGDVAAQRVLDAGGGPGLYPATDSGFVIQRLVEPRAPEIMRERWPEEYEKLARRPGFLALRLLCHP